MFDTMRAATEINESSASDLTQTAQIERETQSVLRGIERYRKGVAALAERPSVEKNMADTPPGQRMQCEILSAFIPHIEQLLEKAATRLSTKGGSNLRKGADFALISVKAKLHFI